MQPANRFTIDQDWSVVVLGFLIIVITLAGLQIPNPSFSWADGDDLFEKIFSSANLGHIFFQFVAVYVIAVTASLLSQNTYTVFLTFPIVFALSLVALLFAGNATFKSINLEAVIFSLGIGLIVRNVFNYPSRLLTGLSSELYVKIGLVLLGTSVIFSDILRAGALGVVQALVVVLAVWYFAYWLCKKLHVDGEMAIMISSAVSICGVSAAIATAGAIKGDHKKLSYVISLVLITAVPMMIFMPMLAKGMGLSETVSGAWIGGSIDTTGAVAASGKLIGETAFQISTIVKFSQNILLGLAAFFIGVYWSYRGKQDKEYEKPSLKVIWSRFPKFVIGFIAASFIFSFMLRPETVNAVKDSLKGIQNLWFVLAFTTIGLETRFADLRQTGYSKPLYAFLIAQLFNIVFTLIIAYLLFA